LLRIIDLDPTREKRRRISLVLEYFGVKKIARKSKLLTKVETQEEQQEEARA
jgi:hypothetical protein